MLAHWRANSSGSVSASESPLLPFARHSSPQLPFLWAAIPEETTSLGSRTSSIMRLSGRASESNGAPIDPFGSFVLEVAVLAQLGEAYVGPLEDEVADRV